MRLAGAALIGCAVVSTVAACRTHTTPSNVKPPDAGITLALYDGGGEGYGLVDDRRWIDIAGTTMLLANIDPGAELASLVIEPATGALRIGPCMRERMPDLPEQDPLEAYAEQQRERRAAELRRRIEVRLRTPPQPEAPKPTAAPDGDRFVPVVKCVVDAKPGRYLVRILYVTKALGYRAQHDIDMRDEARAQVTSRFAIATPVWQARADVVLYDGMPGGERSPREVVRGRIELDGSVAVLAVPMREVAAQLRRIYEGAVVTSEDPTDPLWGQDSVQAIWVWLELAKLRLAPGPIRVHLELPGEGVRDLDVPTPSRRQEADAPDAPLRLPLWVDESLRGSRQRLVEYNDGGSLTERYIFGIANTGTAERDVFIDEPMRKASKRRLDRAWPKKPAAEGNTLRTKLAVKPGRIERTGYTLSYDF